MARKQREYEQSLPVWSCDCGAAYKLLVQWGGQEQFYTITEDGLLGDQVGAIHRSSNGKVRQSGTCPGCGLRFADTIARRANPQRALF
jgi:hypothetical protein